MRALRHFLRRAASLGQLPEPQVQSLRSVYAAASRGSVAPWAPGAGAGVQRLPPAAALLSSRRALFIQTQPTPNPQRCVL
jgi:hypothetical protein